jgi:succinyl-CoA synthetase beta subunit
LKLHEYQAKSLMGSYGVELPRGEVVKTLGEVDRAFRNLGAPRGVVKAQVHAGGRGKAGGIKVVTSVEEAKAEAQALLGTRLVTPQTTSEGQPVNAVYLEAASDVAHEYYLALLLDRSKKRISVLFSTRGGMDIEEVAEHQPEALLTFFVPMSQNGIPPYVIRRMTQEAQWSKETSAVAHSLLQSLYRMYTEKDCTLLEINPLVLTPQGQLLPLDAKVILDDNAAFRHPQWVEQIDLSQENPTEVKANQIGLSYISLEGNIACMVNGAGLAMATMDLIKLHGGEPANFLDVGGGASADQITKAFQIILSDERVKSVLVNIFGGIMRCDIIAEGIIQATQELKPKVPIVVRLEGTHVEKGKAMLKHSGLEVFTAASLDQAAEMAVKKAKAAPALRRSSL